MSAPVTVAHEPIAPRRRVRPRSAGLLVPAFVLVVVLAVASTFVGVANVTPHTLFGDSADAEAVQVLLISRIPRTIALILVGVSMAVAGMIMQILVRNRFVEPSTAGTVESAGLGLVLLAIWLPGLPVLAKMGIATLFALAGTLLFLAILSRVPMRDVLIVPLIGIMLGGVVGSAATFVAYRHDLLQSLGSWMTGDFSAVLRGRYELLWIVGALTLVAYIAADRFTVAGLGRDVSTSLGLAHGRVLALGLTIVSVVTAVVVVSVGAIPFLGLVVPNIVSLVFGDNLRGSLPWVALLGAVAMLACDTIGRLVVYPYEIPIGTTMGVIGAAVFLVMLLRGPDRG